MTHDLTLVLAIAEAVFAREDEWASPNDRYGEFVNFTQQLLAEIEPLLRENIKRHLEISDPLDHRSWLSIEGALDAALDVTPSSAKSGNAET